MAAQLILRIDLGNGRYVETPRLYGEPGIDIREWNGNVPTKKGIRLTLMRWKNFIDQIVYVDAALTKKEAYECHLGGNVYCTVREGNPCVDIRQYWKPEETVVPTRKGLCLRPAEYKKLKENLTVINKENPQVDTILPCYLQGDHMNQLGYLKCSECNPNDFQNW